jgi:thioredoxin reductase
MSDNVNVAIVGAGPYGLSLGAHLGAAGVEFRQFGSPMRLWRASMPKGMFLKSQGFASNLSSPDDAHTLERFCSATDRHYASYGVPVSLDTFVAYGTWFQQQLVPDLEQILVSDITPTGGRFRLTLEDGSRFEAAKVVVAVGVEHFASVPQELAALPGELCTHSSAHTDLGLLRGKRVLVVGAGQSALESAALLHESDAEVTVVARAAEVKWNGEPLPLERPWLQRVLEPEAGLGSGWTTWFYSRHPELFRRLPAKTRVHRARTALGPAGAPWLRSRVEGRFPVLLEQKIQWAKANGAPVVVAVEDGRGTQRELTADHVIAATGYRTDLGRLGFIGGDLRQRIREVAGTPVVNRHYESSVPGLHFIGPAVAPSLGPVMRFVYGSAHAAYAVAGRLGAASSPRRDKVAGTRR